ncbi:hypothetical protein TIFTF001_030458 [Ficus carica]|uniref:Uncharacterized protein n=1 Tax=Ficus carica TaxID=3494 RepID=A0AA88DTQ7_FICCA|nr:hypothetical protein TIFTF001_030458 [Ficus carica]
MLNVLFHGLSWIGRTAFNHSMVSYLPAIPDTRLWKDGAADCFSMYGNELPRVVLIRISHDRHLRGQSYVGGRGVTGWYQSQGFLAIQFHSSAARATVLIKKGSEASLAFQGIEEELRLRTLDRTQDVVSLNGDSSLVMCCKDIFLGYVTLPANDKTRRLEYGALAWRLERRLLNVIFITLRTAYVR